MLAAATTPRERTVPERLALAGVGAAAALPPYLALAGTTGLALRCPLRTVTGVPCPLCGGTTAAAVLLAGQPGEALAANPFAVALAGFVAVMLAVMALRRAGATRHLAVLRRRPWSAPTQRAVLAAVAAATAASWVFQLHRFGWW